MTTNEKGYDPYAFGQVRLGAGSDRGEGSPEDVLFAQPSPPADVGGADTSWDPPEQFSETVVVAQPAVSTKTAAAVAQEAPPRSAVPMREGTDRAATEAPMSGSGVLRPTESGVRRAAAAPVRSVPAVAMPDREPAGLAAVAVPFSILVTVEAAAAWLWVGQENPVLGGLAAVLGVGLAALGWCALRR